MDKRPNRFTFQEDLIIREFWGIEPAAQIAERLGRPLPYGARTVRRRATEVLGLAASDEVRLSGQNVVTVPDDVARRMHHLQRVQGRSLAHIARCTGYTVTVCSQTIARLNAEKSAQHVDEVEQARVELAVPKVDRSGRLARPSWFTEDMSSRLVAGR